MVESSGALSYRPVIAGWGPRVLGIVVDVVALGAALAPGAALLLRGGDASRELLGVLLMVLAYVGATFWYARSVASTGRWLGNRVAGTRVVHAVGGTNLDVGAAATRFVLRTVVSPVLLLGFLVAWRDAQRRTFHDTFVGSIVVGRPRETWSAGDPTP